MKRASVTLAVCLLAIASCAVAQDKKPDFSAVNVQAPYGFWYPSSFFSQPPNVSASTSYYGINIVGLPADAPVLGHFDEHGKVVGGDYVLMLYVDLDTAPITKVWFSGVWATTNQPIGSGTASVQDGQPLALYSFNMGTTSNAQIRAAEGTVQLGIALLKRANQPLETAWGTTLTQVIRIDDTIPGYPSGNYILPVNYSTASLSIGGAAHFKHE